MRDQITDVNPLLKQLKYIDNLKSTITILKYAKTRDLKLLEPAVGTSRILAR